MMQNMTGGREWMMGATSLLFVAVLILGAAARVKYLFFSKPSS